MNPNIKQLEALYWAGRLGSFQAAANRLHTTQSAISKRIAELEAALGRKLFDRTRRNAQLTPAGVRVAECAEQMLALAKHLLDEVSEPEPFQAIFRLAATELTGLTWLPALMKRIAAEFPGLRVEVDVHGGGVLLDQLNKGGYDLALLPGPLWGRIYEALPLKILEREWMASPKLRIPKRIHTVEELAAYPIASQYSDSIHAQLQSAWFHRAGYPLRNVVQAHSFTVLGDLTRAGVVVAQLPVGYYSESLRRKELVRIDVAPELPDVQYFAVYRRGNAHKLASRIARLSQEVCDFSTRTK